MDLQERISILKQGAEIAQKSGILTLDEAYVAKQAIDALNNNAMYETAFDILIKIAINAQKSGAYSLRDAYLLYLASENIESAIPSQQPPQQVQVQKVPEQPQVQEQPAPQPQVQEQPASTPTEKKGRTKKES